MKTLALLISSLGAFAAPVTFTAAGWATPIPNGYFVNLVNQFGTANDRWATFTASEPLLGISFYADNEPFVVGSGWCMYLDGVQVFCPGIGVLIQQTLSFTSTQPFNMLRIEANYAPGTLERGNILNLQGTPWNPPLNPVPEPGTFALVGIVGLVMAGIWCVHLISQKLFPPITKRKPPQSTDRSHS